MLERGLGPLKAGDGHGQAGFLLALHGLGHFHCGTGLGVTGGGRFQALGAGGVFAHQAFIAALVQACAAHPAATLRGVGSGLGNAGLLLGDQAVATFKLASCAATEARVSASSARACAKRAW